VVFLEVFEVVFLVAFPETLACTVAFEEAFCFWASVAFCVAL
jgi:hypothetical protein